MGACKPGGSPAFLSPAGMFAVFILSVGAAAVASIVYARREGLKEQSGKMDHV